MTAVIATLDGLPAMQSWRYFTLGSGEISTPVDTWALARRQDWRVKPGWVKQEFMRTREHF